MKLQQLCFCFCLKPANCSANQGELEQYAIWICVVNCNFFRTNNYVKEAYHYGKVTLLSHVIHRHMWPTCVHMWPKCVVLIAHVNTFSHARHVRSGRAMCVTHM